MVCWRNPASVGQRILLVFALAACAPACAAQGRWANWYRGDKKENLPALLKRIRALTKRGNQG